MSDDEYEEPDDFSFASFTDWRVRIFAPLFLLGLAWAVNASPFKFFLKGLHVWIHELGHATAAWLAGQMAMPIPIGWTSVMPEYSHVVYFGLLFLFGVLAVAGWRERRPAAVVVAVLGAAAQAWMTWKVPSYTQEFCRVAGGVGGEFYLSTAMMAAFFVRWPEWFRWGWCRYAVFFVAASGLLAITARWHDVYRGVEEIPFGSLLHGEEDSNGDMNRLMDDYGWTMAQIRRNYHVLGQVCWAVFGGWYLVFATRLDRLVSRVWRRDELADGEGCEA